MKKFIVFELDFSVIFHNHYALLARIDFIFRSCSYPYVNLVIMYGHETPPPTKSPSDRQEDAVPLGFFAALTLRNHGYPVARKNNPARAGKGGLPTLPEAAAWMTLAAAAKLIRALEIVKDLPLRVPP
ncbi:hypothetical protein [Paenibacillus sp. FSL L8-0463]|uniref:hypothetical protein n=1 Tax=Paenibacillus sp. FSL L8-0463 TaxID=2954687 RepID=UPI00311A34E2